jgi:hypothetical protein
MVWVKDLDLSTGYDRTTQNSASRDDATRQCRKGNLTHEVYFNR